MYKSPVDKYNVTHIHSSLFQLLDKFSAAY